MNGQKIVGIRDDLPESFVMGRKELILVLLHYLTNEMAVVVQHDGKNGNTSHRRTLIPCQKLLLQNFNSSIFQLSIYYSPRCSSTIWDVSRYNDYLAHHTPADSLLSEYHLRTATYEATGRAYKDDGDSA